MYSNQLLKVAETNHKALLTQPRKIIITQLGISIFIFSLPQRFQKTHLIHSHNLECRLKFVKLTFNIKMYALTFEC